MLDERINTLIEIESCDRAFFDFLRDLLSSNSDFHSQLSIIMAANRDLPDYVTLVSNDGFEFKVQRSAACISGAIRRMLDPQSKTSHTVHFFPAPSFYALPVAVHEANHCPKQTDNFQEALSSRCHLESINGVVLEKVCEYLYYNEKNKDAKDVQDMDLPPELCLELLMAADFLNC